MITHFDDKGKIFTDVIQKIPVGVTVQLPSQRLHGMIHLRAEGRVKEEMNAPEPYLALTKVDVYNFEGKNLIFSADFMAVNKSQIVWIVADSDRKEAA